MVKPVEKGRWLYHPKIAGPGRLFYGFCSGSAAQFPGQGTRLPRILAPEAPGFLLRLLRLCLWWAMVG